MYNSLCIKCFNIMVMLCSFISSYLHRLYTKETNVKCSYKFALCSYIHRTINNVNMALGNPKRAEPNLLHAVLACNIKISMIDIFLRLFFLVKLFTKSLERNKLVWKCLTTHFMLSTQCVPRKQNYLAGHPKKYGNMTG